MYVPLGKTNGVLQLAHALVEHETLNSDEVRKVIKGETIRDIKELIKEDLTSISTESQSPVTSSVGP